MNNLEKQRELAREVFLIGVAAADPAAALAARLDQAPLKPLTEGKYIVVSVGKAACAMVTEAIRQIPAQTAFEALAVTNYENATEISGCRVLASGHPVPDANGERAGKEVISLLRGAGKNDVVLALISGGGSALLPCPVEGVSLADKAKVSQILLGAGVDIVEMNMVRQQLSQLKGGGFLSFAAPAKVQAFILSDVIGDDLRAIASGPTVSPIGSRQTAVALLEKHGLWEDIPASVQAHLSAKGQENKKFPPAENTLVGSNRISLEALRTRSNLDIQIASDHLTGDVNDAAKFILETVNKTPSSEPLALVFGGETTVQLTGTGRGGRNQELALRFAVLARQSGLQGDWVFLSGGTDGRDGPTDSAGGLVDGKTLDRIKAAGLDIEQILSNNDSYAALAASQDGLIIGATGTNVADIQIFLRS